MSKGRDLYYAKHIEPAKTPEDMIRALRMSPYSTHRKQAKECAKLNKRLNDTKTAVRQNILTSQRPINDTEIT